MIFDIPNIGFSDKEWLCILKHYLKGWTEIPLTTSDGYNIEELKFYDGFIGTLLKQTEKLLEGWTEDIDERFVGSWKYQGKLYRIMHPFMQVDKDGNWSSVLPEVEYHGMITHWTDDYTFSGLRHKVAPDEEYIILEADTGVHLAFDVNRFRKEYGCEEQFTEKEREFIFPMYKECIKEYCMSIQEFEKMKRHETEVML